MNTIKLIQKRVDGWKAMHQRHQHSSKEAGYWVLKGKIQEGEAIIHQLKNHDNNTN